MPKWNFLAPYEASFLEDSCSVRPHIIFGQRIAADARLIESFPIQDWKGIFDNLVRKIFEFNELDCYHGDIRLDEIYYSKARDRFFLVNTCWMRNPIRAYDYSDAIRIEGPVH